MRAGADLAPRPSGRYRAISARSQIWIGLGVGLLLIAIGLAHLRVETLRLGYQRAEAQRAEAALRSEERRLSLVLRQLRDPVRLETEAERMGFVRPERVVRVPPYGAER